MFGAHEHSWKDGPPSLRIKLSSGRRAIALVDLAAEEKADLLVVGSRQVHGPSRLWQESVSRGALYHAQMSVACVPTLAPLEHAKPPAPERWTSSPCTSTCLATVLNESLPTGL